MTPGLGMRRIEITFRVPGATQAVNNIQTCCWSFRKILFHSFNFVFMLVAVWQFGTKRPGGSWSRKGGIISMMLGRLYTILL